MNINFKWSGTEYSLAVNHEILEEHKAYVVGKLLLDIIERGSYFYHVYYVTDSEESPYLLITDGKTNAKLRNFTIKGGNP